MIIDKIFAALLFIILFPLWAVFYFLIKLTSTGPVLFKQLRTGKNKKPFLIYKFRTMVANAEDMKKQLQRLNETDWPVFKIHNDPRYTKLGKFLSHTGLDELPQLINVIKGNMSLVGPRPLPVLEAKQIPAKYQGRFSVLPGITSPWILLGSHKISFKEWMESDLAYIKDKSVGYDFLILGKSFLLVLTFIFRKIFNTNEES